MHRPVRLSIIIPTLNEAERLPRALASAQRLPDAEIIVVDGGSHDGTPDVAAEFDCRVLMSERGRAVQMNAGAAIASGDVLLFLHADCQLPEHSDRAIAAVLADPFSVSFHGILKRPPKPGQVALVWGCGTLGLCAIAILRRLFPETRVLAVARFDHQRRLAEKFGATRILAHTPARAILEEVAAELGTEILEPWNGLPMLNGGVDVVYDTVGAPETVETAVRLTRPRGAIVVTGVEAPARFEWTPLYFKEIELIGSNAFGFEDFEGTRRHAMEIYFDLVQAGRIDLTPIVTHRFALERYGEAFEACWDQGGSGAVKVLFDYAEASASLSRSGP